MSNSATINCIYIDYDITVVQNYLLQKKQTIPAHAGQCFKHCI